MVPMAERTFCISETVGMVGTLGWSQGVVWQKAGGVGTLWFRAVVRTSPSHQHFRFFLTFLARLHSSHGNDLSGGQPSLTLAFKMLPQLKWGGPLAALRPATGPWNLLSSFSMGQLGNQGKWITDNSCVSWPCFGSWPLFASKSSGRNQPILSVSHTFGSTYREFRKSHFKLFPEFHYS